MNISPLFSLAPDIFLGIFSFIAIAALCLVAFSIWLYYNGYGFRYTVLVWALFLLILATGYQRAERKEQIYRETWTQVLLGMTRSFVSTTETLGHSKITRQTSMDDPLYKRIRALHAAWCRDVPVVAYVFTLRLREDANEKVDWIVSCESDVNRDGRIEGLEELGEALYQAYDEWFPIYGEAFAGQVVLDDRIHSEMFHDDFVTAVAPLRNENGAIEAILGVDFRVDQWNRMLGQIRSASAQLLAILLTLYVVAVWLIGILHHSVRRVTKANQELRVAKREADAAARAKSDFLANMSHEIRTPMNALLGFTDILTRRIEQNCSPQEREESQGIMEIIRKSGQDLLTIINDILDFSRIEANLLQIDSVPVSIKQVIEDVWQMEMNEVVEKHLDFSVKYKDPVPELILSDPARLRQILLNLISNAIKFTDSGSVTVQCEIIDPPNPTAGTKSRSGDDSSNTPSSDITYPVSTILRIDVIDTGIGITPEQMRHLFRPFTQADGSSTRRFGGTGLGLSIAKRLAKLMDGDISAVSTPHAGSTFTLQLHVYLPTEEQSSAVQEKKRLEEEQERGSRARLLEKKPEPPAPSTDSHGPRPEAEQPLRNVRVLLVEDMVVNQIVISTQLRDAGATVEIAGNGEIGVQKINHDSDDGLFFDVVLMDMQMPVMDGYEATTLLRSQGYNRPIIAITAHALTGDREKTIEAGCDDYIAKPVDRLVLIKTIKQYCR